METALVHDYLLVLRGAERTFSEMASVWPDAPIHTLLYDEAGTRGTFADRTVTTSPLQRLRVRQRGFRRMLPLFPWGIQALDLDPAKLVVSSSSAFAHGLRKPPGAMHVCYCHSPFRYVWQEFGAELAIMPRGLRAAEATLLKRIRAWDLSASHRVDHYIANSRITQERLATFYGRHDVPIVHPPVNVDRFTTADEPEDWFLVVGEVVRHKRTDLALEAAARAGVPIKIVGEGPAMARLAARYAGAGGQAEFLGRVGDAQLADLYARCRALVVPNIEEFGIAAVEAQAAGRPVIGMASGGTGETVVHGRTGILLERQDVNLMASAMLDADLDRFDPAQLVEHAARFGATRFRAELAAEVERRTGAAAPALAGLAASDPVPPLERRPAS
ncbi:MAG TPA: glycosyltransferase [Baekduia sp.]|nr:glycosyltransferase [Baekduia sp.]